MAIKPPRSKVQHPAWCDTSRCQAGRLTGRYGAHRSEPITLGAVTLTLTQNGGNASYMEVRARTRLVDFEGDEGRHHAFIAGHAVVTELRKVANVFQGWHNDLREYSSPYAPYATSQAPTGGEH